MPKRDKEWERFRVIKRLGAGSFRRTLLVVDASKGDRQVVIKVPHDKKTEKALINDSDQRQRSNGESRRIVSSQHRAVSGGSTPSNDIT